jgi:hypothetical protein
LAQILIDLNYSNSRVRRSIQLNRMFRIRKCRLRLENLTRWSSAYLLLESVKRAFDGGLFDEFEPEEIPVTLETIEIYLQVLKPAYLFSIHFQGMNANISETIPSVLKLIQAYKKMKLTGEPKKLAKLIIKSIKHKFEYELNSHVYMAAAILKVNQLNTWIGRPFSKGYFTKGIESLKKCATRFLFINNEIEKQNQQNEQNSSQPVQNNKQPYSPALISPNTGFEEFVKSFFTEIMKHKLF